MPAGEKSSKPSRSVSPDKTDRNKEKWNDNDDSDMNDGERRGREIDRRKGIKIFFFLNSFVIYISYIIVVVIIIIVISKM